MIGRRANVAHAQHLISRRGSGLLQLCAKTGANLKRNFRRLCLCSWFRMESRPRLCQHPLQILLIFLSNNLSESSVALRVVALVGLTAAAPTARPPSPARSIEGRLVQGGPGLPASSDCCGEPPAAALRLPATSNINETNNGRNIGSSPFTGGIADLPSKQEVVCRLPDSGLPIIA
jgi:hypothetical protein